MRALLSALVSVYDWLLFLHVLGGFALLGGITGFWALVLATRVGDGLLPRQSELAVERPLIAITLAGAVLTLVFGIWLALYVDDYNLWDGWILGSLVLWAIGNGAGALAGRAFTRAAESEAGAPQARRQGLVLHTVSTVAILIVLALMIFKPGA